MSRPVCLVDPDTIDGLLNWKTKNVEGATCAGVSH
jgi:hypothetical protein